MSAPNPDQALLQLLQFLSARHYHFITTTPLTHQRVLARAGQGRVPDLTDIFGWSRAFDEAEVEAELISLMRRADILLTKDGVCRSRIRVSSLEGSLFIHSAYPTVANDAVFFGPDTYRFVRFIQQNLPSSNASSSRSLRFADIGCGSGAAGIVLARALPGATGVLTDINPQAFRLSAINARHAGVEVDLYRSDVLLGVEGGFDLLICNPPYIDDAQQRAYRHGGRDLGRELSLRIAREAVGRLNPGGRLLLYTGSAIVDGRDGLLEDLRLLFDQREGHWSYSEIDPDVFGEELEEPGYASVDRIAAVGLVLTRSGPLSSTADSGESRPAA